MKTTIKCLACIFFLLLFGAATNFAYGQCSPSDPGASSSLILVSGTVNGQNVTPSGRIVTVAPGAPISGSLTVSINSAWSSADVMAMAWTPTWGASATSFVDLGGFETPVTGLQRTFSFNLNAPTSAGTYYIIAAFRAEYTAGQVMSATNWSLGYLDWNTGYAVVGWSSSTINTADSAGTVCVNYTFPSGAYYTSPPADFPVYVPATAIQIQVAGSNTNITGIQNVVALSNVSVTSSAACSFPPLSPLKECFSIQQNFYVANHPGDTQFEGYWIQNALLFSYAIGARGLGWYVRPAYCVLANSVGGVVYCPSVDWFQSVRSSQLPAVGLKAEISSTGILTLTSTIDDGSTKYVYTYSTGPCSAATCNELMYNSVATSGAGTPIPVPKILSLDPGAFIVGATIPGYAPDSVANPSAADEPELLVVGEGTEAGGSGTNAEFSGGLGIVSAEVELPSGWQVPVDIVPKFQEACPTDSIETGTGLSWSPDSGGIAWLLASPSSDLDGIKFAPGPLPDLTQCSK